MAGQNTAVFGTYREREGVERAIDILRTAGFRKTDDSVLFPENEGTKDLAFVKGTKAPEGAAAGAGTGALLGGALGWLVGIGTVVIPGLGPLLAAGPIVAALAGVGAAGVVGGLIGALIGLGAPEYEAKRYNGQIRRGRILVSMHCDNPNWTKRAKDILKETGAENIASAREASADFATSDKPMPRRPTRLVQEERRRRLDDNCSEELKHESPRTIQETPHNTVELEGPLTKRTPD